MWKPRLNFLTDTDGPYIELMADAYSDNQPDYSWLQPYEVRIIKQYWYPLRKIGGVKKANLEAAVNLQFTSEKEVKIGLNTSTAYKEVEVVLESEKALELNVNHIWAKHQLELLRSEE